MSLPAGSPEFDAFYDAVTDSLRPYVGRKYDRDEVVHRIRNDITVNNNPVVVDEDTAQRVVDKLKEDKILKTAFGNKFKLGEQASHDPEDANAGFQAHLRDQEAARHARRSNAGPEQNLQEGTQQFRNFYNEVEKSLVDFRNSRKSGLDPIFGRDIVLDTIQNEFSTRVNEDTAQRVVDRLKNRGVLEPTGHAPINADGSPSGPEPAYSVKKIQPLPPAASASPSDFPPGMPESLRAVLQKNLESNAPATAEGASGEAQRRGFFSRFARKPKNPWNDLQPDIPVVELDPDNRYSSTAGGPGPNPIPTNGAGGASGGAGGPGGPGSPTAPGTPQPAAATPPVATSPQQQPRRRDDPETEDGPANSKAQAALNDDDFDMHWHGGTFGLRNPTVHADRMKKHNGNRKYSFKLIEGGTAHVDDHNIEYSGGALSHRGNKKETPQGFFHGATEIVAHRYGGKASVKGSDKNFQMHALAHALAFNAYNQGQIKLETRKFNKKDMKKIYEMASSLGTLYAHSESPEAYRTRRQLEQLNAQETEQRWQNARRPHTSQQQDAHQNAL